ncbi:LytR/AlgR family response regulator transcription factor [Flavilitoribacter nigricans]|uniref:DNA-binding response regulator n=1 Tax=Flavilitoribacter nigricans (strain ATCC 23147 / DSM 23189 / NBRC 102662 / NCIMB 1420 / SS-2) TaxID=1122177 RepID=A0A2D0N5V5_FLAN2|nr:response regulator [Flavilitoribacter nigricans]PHN03153.1 DNA-binding response regulator [Flavilitoribacter nigricans DSM 23189 = NBRC 102662]
MQKVIIIDDEAPARSLLREYLSHYPELVIIGEANNGVDGIKLVHEFKPDIVFLDIEMPGMTGLEVLRHLKESPKVIFSTAYDQYAVNAFELNAVDYLLKPYTRERFNRAVERLEVRQRQPLDSLHALAESLLKQERQIYPARILVSSGQKLIAIPTASIIWINADGDYSNMVTDKQTYLSNFGIGQLEEKLDPELFIRVHRSSMINISKVQEIFKYPASYDIRMINGDVVRVSRSYLDKIRDITF